MSIDQLKPFGIAITDPTNIFIRVENNGHVQTIYFTKAFSERRCHWLMNPGRDENNPLPGTLNQFNQGGIIDCAKSAHLMFSRAARFSASVVWWLLMRVPSGSP